MNEIIIDDFLNVTPSEHVAFHDRVLLHLQAAYCDMASLEFSGGSIISFRKLVNEIYIAESRQGRGMDRLIYSKTLRYVVLQSFESYLSELDLLNKLIIRMTDTECDVVPSVIEHSHYLLSKLASCQFVLEKVLTEQELSLANHSLTHGVEKYRRNADRCDPDLWRKVWDFGNKTDSSQQQNFSFGPLSSLKSKRKHHV